MPAHSQTSGRVTAPHSSPSAGPFLQVRLPCRALGVVGNLGGRERVPLQAPSAVCTGFVAWPVLFCLYQLSQSLWQLFPTDCSLQGPLAQASPTPGHHLPFSTVEENTLDLSDPGPFFLCSLLLLNVSPSLASAEILPQHSPAPGATMAFP